MNELNWLLEKIEYLNGLIKDPNHLKQDSKHNALDNVRWNFKLYKFLNTL